MPKVKEAIEFIQKHRDKNGYYVVKEVNRLLLESAMKFVFEDNASTYIRKIRIEK